MLVGRLLRRRGWQTREGEDPGGHARDMQPAGEEVEWLPVEGDAIEREPEAVGVTDTNIRDFRVERQRSIEGADSHRETAAR